MADCSAMGWGMDAVCNSVTSTGDGSIGAITIVLAIGVVISWLIAIWLFETKRPVFAFAAYVAGLFSLMMAVFSAIDATAISNPATANMLQMFVFPLTWLLIGSVLAFILYVFLGTLVGIANTFGVKVKNWWYDGQSPS